LRATEHFDQTDEPALADPLNLQRTRRVVTTELFGASLRHAHDTWSIMPRYNFTLIDFSTSGTTGGPTTAATLTDEHTEIHVLGLDGTLQALPRNVIALGYEYTIARFRVSPDFTGHLGRVSLTREVDPQMIAGVVRQQRSALEIRVEPAPPLTVSLRGSHTESTFLQAGTFATTTGITTTGGHRRDTTIEGSVEIAYKLSRALTLSLRYTRVE